MKERLNFEWPDKEYEEHMRNEEKIIRERAHHLIQKGKLDLYEYALYIEKEMSLKELIEVVENQIRMERYDELCEMRMQECD